MTPEFAPPSIPSLILVYTFSSVTYTQPYFPLSIYWTDPESGVLSYQFSVPGGSTAVGVVGIPPTWLLEDAGPGAITFTPGAESLVFDSFNSTPTDGGDLFSVQLLAPLPEEPLYASLVAEVTVLTAQLELDNASLGARIEAAEKLTALALEEENGTYTYRLTPGTVIRAGLVYELPIFVGLMSGGLANATVTSRAASGLEVAYVAGTGTLTTPTWETSNLGAGSFTLTVNLSSSEADQIANGSSVVTLSAPVTIGTFTNLAGGVIGPSSFTNETEPSGWWSTIFGIQTPPPSDDPTTVGEIIADLAWFGDSTAGRAMYALVTLVAVITYVLAAHKQARRAISGKREIRPGGSAT
ncbi:MAG: hypothetical protein L3K07_03855 [Thermoplasmata archaeon]|nr:hypothetical protein [Thermoplasmata archaeon]